MVDRRAEVQHYHGDSKDAGADNVGGVTVLYGGDNQNRRGGQRNQEAKAVTEAVGDLFRRRLRAILQVSSFLR
jgi:hypothetical protein